MLDFCSMKNITDISFCWKELKIKLALLTCSLEKQFLVDNIGPWVQGQFIPGLGCTACISGWTAQLEFVELVSVIAVYVLRCPPCTTP
ncbi:hypothetical protein MIDIC_70076 [Alphaproteobacteria bacterium]